MRYDLEALTALEAYARTLRTLAKTEMVLLVTSRATDNDDELTNIRGLRGAVLKDIQRLLRPEWSELEE